MLERRVVVTNPLGLHARAAAQLVRLAANFKSNIEIRREDTGVSADAKSILSVLYVAAGVGVEITITADGIDDETAVNAIYELFARGFGEI